jgi:hypothetical protein
MPPPITAPQEPACINAATLPSLPDILLTNMDAGHLKAAAAKAVDFSRRLSTVSWGVRSSHATSCVSRRRCGDIIVQEDCNPYPDGYPVSSESIPSVPSDGYETMCWWDTDAGLCTVQSVLRASSDGRGHLTACDEAFDFGTEIGKPKQSLADCGGCECGNQYFRVSEECLGWPSASGEYETTQQQDCIDWATQFGCHRHELGTGCDCIYPLLAEYSTADHQYFDTQYCFIDGKGMCEAFVVGDQQVGYRCGRWYHGQP